MDRESNRGVRTRGGPRGRGRRLRTRGGRGVGRGQSRHIPVDNLPLVLIEDVPLRSSLERPLHVKRRRTWSPSPRSSVVPSPPTAAASTSVDASSVGAEDQPPSPACFVECEPIPNPSVSTGSMSSGPQPSTSQASGHAPQLSRRDFATGAEIEPFVDYGSEPESSDDDEVHEVLLRSWHLQMVDEMLTDEPPVVDDSSQVFEEPESPPSAAYTPAVYPQGMYEFEWKSFPDSPIPPESRREIFSQSNVGPTLPVEDPYDAFIAIWDRPIVEIIVRETNKYAQHLTRKMIEQNLLQPVSRIGEWYDTSVDEIYLFIGLILAMGVVVKSRIDEYWSKAKSVASTPGFNSIMSHRRFEILCRCLHFSDNESMVELNLDRAQAKLYKIQPIIDHLNKKFQELYVLDRNLALDESLLQWKGLLNINQHIPNKRAKIGIKSYELCESQTGYLWRFEIHAHDRLNTPPSSSDPVSAPIPSIVLRMVQGLEHKGYTLWMDNYYNSPALARKLKTIGFDCAGTLRTKRRFVPKSLNTLTKTMMQPGQITGSTSGDVDLLVWRDQNRVAAISTYHGISACLVQGKLKPVLIQDYNIMMGGVDKKDQMLAMYPIERKRTKVWYKKLFRRLLNVSVLNAYIISKGSGSRKTHRDFRWVLMNSLIERHTVRPVVVPFEPRTRVNVYDARTHYPEEYPLNQQTRSRLRRQCTICKKKVGTYCVGCAKTVCISRCFVSLHNLH